MRHSDRFGDTWTDGGAASMGVGHYSPRVKHIVAPKIQHHTTEAGPPRVNGVLKVVAILEQRPMILKAKLIWRRVSIWGSDHAYSRLPSRC